EIILDHYRAPRNRGELESPTCSADGSNPLCGDQVHVAVELDGDRIESIRFSGEGCSISQASASMMTEHVLGMDGAHAHAAIEQFQALMLNGEPPADSELGDSEALAGVAKFPARVKCASLGWKTLEQALDREHSAPVTTDEREQQDG
ncbi:MAG: SUF system NifU family Fe-S cluster assembly protein, partial [Dehalococcoidia bacterium]|nr:SUF system NifU family Fe-S cluster assembly protein [Dehalococcoidia bacterium]